VDRTGNYCFGEWFRFEAGGQSCMLQAYKSDPAEERLFLPKTGSV